MNLLVLAPQPFFQERGTPIAVRLALEVLAERHASKGDTLNEDKITLLTYHEGADIQIPGVRVLRIWAPSFLKGVPPGFSLKKIFCDLFFTFSTLKLVWRERGSQFSLIHAVEESVFIAWLCRQLFGIPYVYDMDSSLSLQLSEKLPLLKFVLPLLEFFERVAVKGSIAVVPVCDALASIAERHGSKETFILRDISLLKKDELGPKVDLRQEAGASASDLLVVYIGNLESYQGIDLLIEAFSLVAPQQTSSKLVVIGGVEAHVKYYQAKANELGIASRVAFLGPRPVEKLNAYISEADILVSPRVKGNNTPMKIYSYLHAGKGLVATNLATHTQVLDSQVCELVEPNPQAFADGLSKLLNDSGYRNLLGERARQLAERNYTFDVFKERLNGMYDKIGKSLQKFSQALV